MKKLLLAAGLVACIFAGSAEARTNVAIGIGVPVAPAPVYAVPPGAYPYGYDPYYSQTYVSYAPSYYYRPHRDLRYWHDRGDWDRHHRR